MVAGDQGRRSLPLHIQETSIPEDIWSSTLRTVALWQAHLQPAPTIPRRSGRLTVLYPEPGQGMGDAQPVVEMEVGPLDLRD